MRARGIYFEGVASSNARRWWFGVRLQRHFMKSIGYRVAVVYRAPSRSKDTERLGANFQDLSLIHI